MGAVGSATTAGPCPAGIVEPSKLVAVESQGSAVGGVVPANPFVPRFREATVAWLGEDGWPDASDARSGPHAVGAAQFDSLSSVVGREPGSDRGVGGVSPSS